MTLSPPGPSALLDMLIEAEYEDFCRRHYREASTRSYIRGAEAFMQFLVEWNAFDVWANMPENTLAVYDEWMSQSGYSPSTAAQRHAAAKSYLYWLEHALGERIPEQRKFKKRKIVTKVKEALTPELYGQYFQACNEEEEPMRTATMLLVCCGLRSEELVRLRVDDLEQSQVQLSDGQMKQTLSVRVEDGKGGKSRVVPLLDEGVEVLNQYFDGPWLEVSHGSRYLFPSRKYLREPVQTRTLRYAVERVGKRMGIKMSPHTLRRTYLTQLWRMGVEYETIAKIGGHSDPKTLYKHYLAMTTEDLATAVHEHGGALTRH